jgi:hypothetical protein
VKAANQMGAEIVIADCDPLAMSKILSKGDRVVFQGSDGEYVVVDDVFQFNGGARVKLNHPVVRALPWGAPLMKISRAS